MLSFGLCFLAAQQTVSSAVRLLLGFLLWMVCERLIACWLLKISTYIQSGRLPTAVAFLPAFCKTCCSVVS